MHDVPVAFDAPEHAPAHVLGPTAHGAAALVAGWGGGGLLGRGGMVNAVELAVRNGGGVYHAGEEVTGGLADGVVAPEEAWDIVLAEARVAAVKGVKADDGRGDVLGDGEGGQGPEEKQACRGIHSWGRSARDGR